MRAVLRMGIGTSQRDRVIHSLYKRRLAAGKMLTVPNTS